jgi:superfamily II DNA/RNA helicase
MQERAVVFTEYRDTLLHVRDRLGRPCAVLHGGMARHERRASLEEFTSGNRQVLLAPDAAGEGLNLHAGCRTVINLELPWNPTRLEQRAGRVDRIGQRRTAHAFHLIADDTGEIDVLERLELRIAQARLDVAVADPLHSASVDDQSKAARFVVGAQREEKAATSEAEALPPARDARPARQVIRVATAAEYARLTFVRAISARGHGAGSFGSDRFPALAFTRKWRTRLRLGGRLLVVACIDIEDAYGRIVASLVTAATGQTTSPTGRDLELERLSQMWHQPGGATSVLLQAATRFSAEASRVHRDFWETRLRRERAIAAILGAARSSPLQFGLFDSRAVRDAAARTEEQRTAMDEAERRTREAELLLRTHSRGASVALVLVP